MALETFPYDAAEFLTEPHDVFFFLEAELEEDDPAYWPGAVAIVARARGGMDRLAKESGLPVAMLHAAADESSLPDRGVIVKLMEAFRPGTSSDQAHERASHAI
jgi:probable addiction module antidote protein